MHLSPLAKLSPPRRSPNLEPPTYFLITLITLIALALTPPGRSLTLLCYGLGILGLLLWRRIPWRPILQRVLIEFTFLILLLLGSLFHPSGDPWFSFGPITLTRGGLTLFISTSTKAFLSLLLVNALQQRLTLPQFLEALRRLHCPPLLIAIMESMMRYLGLLQQELHRMHQAAIARNGLASPRNQRHTLATLIATLFIRTLNRGERIHQAMIARGYNGLLPPSTASPLPPQDQAVITAITLLAIAPQLIP